MIKKLLLFTISVSLLFCTGCKDTDLTPAFIYVTEDDINNSVDVSTFNSDHDLNYDSEKLSALQQHNFTHVNVYVNNKNLGCWQVPCKIPVLDVSDKDSATLVLLPCFRKTGMQATVQGYPFFNVLRQKVLLHKNETYHVADNPPTYKYSQYAHFPFFETFANSSSFVVNDTNHNHNFYPTLVEGRTVGEITLNGINDYFDVSSINIPVPMFNYYVYLEVTYKIDGNMDIGVKLSSDQYNNTVHPLGGIYSSNGEWKTIYFDLANIIHGYNYTGVSAATINLVLSGSGAFDDKPTHYYIDNIKVIYEPAA